MSCSCRNARRHSESDESSVKDYAEMLQAQVSCCTANATSGRFTHNGMVTQASRTTAKTMRLVEHAGFTPVECSTGITQRHIGPTITHSHSMHWNCIYVCVANDTHANILTHNHDHECRDIWPMLHTWTHK